MNRKMAKGRRVRRIGGLAAFILLVACNLGVADPVVGPAPQLVAERFVPEPPGWRLVPWIEGLEAPWSLAFLPDGRALVSERPGRIRLIQDGRLQTEPYASFEVVSGASADALARLFSVFADGEGGLMGLAVHPDFPRQPFIYAMQTYEGEGGIRNRILRLRDGGRTASVEGVVFDGIPGWIVHDGGRLGFGPDGMLHATTGENFESELAQDLESAAGKILRITPDGAVPDDNPFSGSPIWSYGHRNPQGLAWHPASGALFASEHGPTGEFGLQAYDEVNVIWRGANYGWPRAVGAPGLDGLEDPILVWAEDAVPPAGMAFHGGDLFLGALGSGALVRISLAPTGEGYRVTAIENWFARSRRDSILGRIRDVVEGPDGHLYFLTSNRDGRGDPRPGDDHIYRLERVE